jgi:hypothetical protein
MFRPFLVIALLAAPFFASPAWALVIQADAADQRRLIPVPAPRPPIPAPPGRGWVWVPPVYRTVYTRTWRPPVYQTVTENVWIPDRYDWQTVCTWENGQYVQREAWVLIPGHFETQTRQVMISPGWWTLAPRQELVSPGHGEWRGPAPMPPPVPQPTPPVTPAPRPPGLEPFSPLWEWPPDSK